MEFTSNDLPLVIEIPNAFSSTSELYADMLYIQKLAKEETNNQKLRMQHINQFFVSQECYQKAIQADRMQNHLGYTTFIIN